MEETRIEEAMEQNNDFEQEDEQLDETAKGSNPMVGFAAGFAAGVGLTKLGDRVARKVKTKLAQKKDAESNDGDPKPKKGHLAIRNPFYRKSDEVVEPTTDSPQKKSGKKASK